MTKFNEILKELHAKSEFDTLHSQQMPDPEEALGDILWNLSLNTEDVKIISFEEGNLYIDADGYPCMDVTFKISIGNEHHTLKMTMAHHNQWDYYCI